MSDSSALTEVDIPSPAEFLGGWAALSAVSAAGGFGDDVYANAERWVFHDGGGNWAVMRFHSRDRVVLYGYDHEYTQTYFGAAASYFEEEETDLLHGAPEWWSADLKAPGFEDWFGFIYGWNGELWQRASYEKDDGFNSVGLMDACSFKNTSALKDFAENAPDLPEGGPDEGALRALIVANGKITESLLQAVVPGWDIRAGVAAGRKFLLAGV